MAKTCVLHVQVTYIISCGRQLFYVPGAWVFEGALNVIVVTHGHLWDEYLWLRWVRRQEKLPHDFLNLLDFGLSY